MKNLFKNQKIQKLFCPLAMFCFVPIWFLLRQGKSPSMAIYILAAIGFFFFLLDRILKPWELDRAEKQLKKTKSQLESQQNKTPITEESDWKE